MGKTNIEWADETWPVTRGCRRTAPAGSAQSGCGDATGGGCYAERMADRIVRMGRGKPTKYDGLVKLVKRGDKMEPRWTGTARFCPEELATPLHMRKGRRIFVSSMSDLFHEDITNEQIAAVFGVMAACPQHTFMVLTKRARRMREWFEWVAGTGYDPGHVLSLALGDLAEQDRDSDARFSDDEWLVGLCNVVNGRSSWRHHDDGNPLDGSRPRWPLPNVMLGVSCENQAAADERIPELLRTPAAVRWISAEPLLGPIDLDPPRCDEFDRHGDAGYCFADDGTPWCSECESERSYGHWLGDADCRIDLVVAGCESGAGARECDLAWLRSLRDQCSAAEVVYFLKQARRHTLDRVLAPDSAPAEIIAVMTNGGLRYCDPISCGPGSHRKSGGIIGAPYLDGVQHLALPR